MNFKTESFAHQLTSLELAKDRKYWGHFHEMGAGKTKIVIDNANYLHEKQEIFGVLVIAPNGVHRNWANRELPAHSYPSQIGSVFTWNGKPQSAKKKMEFAHFLAHSYLMMTGLPWMFINIEAIRTEAGLGACEEFLKRTCNNKGMIVIDESTVIKTPKAKQTKAALYLGTLAPYRRILTGTPITQGPLDFYSQCKFLDRNSIPFTSFTAFRNTFSIERQVVLNSGKRFNQVVGYTKLGYLKRLVEPFSDRVLKKDCLDLPEKLYQQVSVDLHPEQRQIYNTMRDLYITRLAEQESSTGVVTAQNALTLMMKLQQIATGFLIDDENVIHSIPNHRLDRLLSIIEGFTGKAIIWCAFRKNISDVVGSLRDAYDEDSVVSYFGDTSNEKREISVERFMDDDRCRFFVSNKTGAEGLTLTSAEYSIYYSNIYSLHFRLQSEGRNHRIGQIKNVLYTDLYCPGTVDEKILKALKSKKDLADQILTNWREIL